MRKILAIAWNDIQIEFSSRWTLVFFLLLPLVFTWIVGTALSEPSGQPANLDSRAPVLLVDRDEGTFSAQLIQTISISTTIRPVVQPSEAALEQFKNRQALALLTIPTGFSQSLLDGQPSALDLQLSSRSTETAGIEQALRAAVREVSASAAIAIQSTRLAESRQPFDSQRARQAYMQDSLNAARLALASPPVKAETISGSTSVDRIIPTGFAQSSPGQLVTWVLITLIGGAEVFVDERLSGTLRRLLVTPSRKGTLIAGKITGRLILGLIQMALLIGFGILALKVRWGQSLAALAVMMVAFGLAGTALGVMLGAFARTRSQASGLTVLFSMLLASLGGAWWPMEITPPLYQKLVQILPSTWAMKGLVDVSVRGYGVAQILPEAGVLLAFAAVFFFIGVRRLRFE